MKSDSFNSSQKSYNINLFDRVDGRKVAFANILSKYGDALIGEGKHDEGQCSQIEALQICKANGLPKNHPNVMKIGGPVPNYDAIQPSVACSIIDGDKHSMRIEF